MYVSFQLTLCEARGCVFGACVEHSVAPAFSSVGRCEHEAHFLGPLSLRMRDGILEVIGRAPDPEVRVSAEGGVSVASRGPWPHPPTCTQAAVALAGGRRAVGRGAGVQRVTSC